MVCKSGAGKKEAPPPSPSFPAVQPHPFKEYPLERVHSKKATIYGTDYNIFLRKIPLREVPYVASL